MTDHARVDCYIRQHENHLPVAPRGAAQGDFRFHTSHPTQSRHRQVALCPRVLRSMALALPESRGLFSQMQEALCLVKDKRFTLSTGVHEALSDFKWLAEDVANCPTQMYELVPLRPTVDGYHDSSGYMCGSVVLPGPTAMPRKFPPLPSTARPSPKPNGSHPIVWRMPCPKEIVDSLVSWTNPQLTVNNSELELAGGVVHSDCVAKCFVVTERTTLLHIYNTAGLWWQRKGSATCISSPAHLLQLQDMHQRFHRYAPPHRFCQHCGQSHI